MIDCKLDYIMYNLSLTEEVIDVYINIIYYIMIYCKVRQINIDAIFDEVQRSNMSKSCASLEEAQRTVEKYNSDERYNADIKKVDEMYIVYDKNTSKILKSINFSEPQDLINLASS